jgi:hypothetical protein
LIEYEEIRFNTRDPVADADLIEKLKNNTRALGIKFDDKDLTVVDHS